MRLVVVLVLLGSASAHAEGFVTGGSFGPGLSVARLGWEGPAASGFGGSGGTVDQADLATFVSLSLELRAGHRVGERYTLGLEVQGTLLLVGDEAVLGYTSFEHGASATARVVGTWRGERGRRVGLGAGAGIATFGGGTLTIGAPDNVARHERLLGPSLAATYGWLWGTTQAEVEATTAYLFGAHLSYVPVTVSLRLRFGAM